MPTVLLHLKHNVHEGTGKEVVRVQADIDKAIYEYFFQHVIAYTHGARQAMITFFFQRFYEECLAQGIHPVWDEENAPRIVEILNRLNFTEQGRVVARVASAENNHDTHELTELSQKPKKHRKARLPKL